MNVSDNTASTPDDKTPLQPMKPTDILDAMFSLYLRHFRLFLGISAVYFVAMLVFNFTLFGWIFYTLSNTPLGLGHASARWGTAIVILFVIVVPTIVFVTLLVTGGLIFASARCYLGEQTTFSVALQHVLRRFFPYFGSSLLWGLAVGAFPFAIYLAVSLLWGLIVGVLATTLIGIPFAIYFAVLWYFYSVAVLVEDKPIMQSFRRSKELVKGTWWRVFGILLAIYLLIFMVNFILNGSLGLILSLVGGAQGVDILELMRQIFLGGTSIESSNILLFSLIRNFINLAVTTFLLPLGIIGTVLLYYDLRIRKEGFDIERMATHVDTEQETPVNGV